VLGILCALETAHAFGKLREITARHPDAVVVGSAAVRAAAGGPAALEQFVRSLRG
jgi:hypothetical protein